MGYNNPAFVDDDNSSKSSNTRTTTRNDDRQQQPPTAAPTTTNDVVHETTNGVTGMTTTVAGKTSTTTATKERANWGNDIEFLMSCIAMSVGLGNIWRFPFTALENGGGAFLIPYLIVLLIIGRPLYYMEMLLGQFSSRSSIKVFDLAPALRGVGYAQVISTGIVATYYVTIMAITLHYFFNSFKSTLPWTICLTEWGDTCKPSAPDSTVQRFNESITESRSSSAELYYTKEVLKEYPTIQNGIGTPDIYLTMCLGLTWVIIVSVLIKGVQSSGKASYFLALFPYVILLILLARAVTLPGAFNGILFFIRPQWDKLFDPTVWYAAIVQCFFSLAVCFGNLIMYASFNRFDHNVYRDATIVTTLDTFTSLLAGFTIFGILGHLAHETGATDIGEVVKGGAGLAFISYPDAIARFRVVPQVFSVLFFFMLFVLGIGSNIAMCSCITTAILDQFPKWKPSIVVLAVAFFGFLIGLLYITPGGQFILNLVDFFGASFIVFILAIAEMVAVCWIYGVDRLCRDAEFMINRNPGRYWRTCWGILTPLIMIVILIYTLISYKPLKYKDQLYPPTAYAIGWTISAIGLMQLPLWAVYTVIKQNGDTWSEKIRNSFHPNSKWGPVDPVTMEKYQKYIANWHNQLTENPPKNIWQKIMQKIYG
ncbi:sodium-dependent nutrient amino acid transporter 1-like [Contarinia nasturtii]|uniref:sodium-dependent nutrient amino acid transporter 1-like n=1 Tax=Contarinia nasturtii TaxID=265458 RepID=UPI0012D42E20|nr:sodium-dependent nutrient amino acid transporter 1-like [Contarinia nasturtii]XP_031631152.1 sodium-dependent nutrient amino acid transporter 1-like [Contarinia nasturtii]XP_031631153.1 sodium-dependent nutrient amino acid transporter 1-like [Contarinia nasturtii]